MTNAPGSKFLLVVGILYIVFGGFGVIGAISGLALTNHWNTTLPTASGMSWAIFYGFGLVAALFSVFIGLMGLLNRERLEKAAMLRMLGVIALLFIIVEAIFSMAVFAGALGGVAAVFSIIFGAVLPVLYIIGAQKNVSAQKTR